MLGLNGLCVLGSHAYGPEWPLTNQMQLQLWLLLVWGFGFPRSSALSRGHGGSIGRDGGSIGRDDEIAFWSLR